MKAAIFENDKLLISDLDKPTMDNSQKGAIIKVLGCGLCGSDIIKLLHKTIKNGSVLGHEVVGIISEINSDTNFKKGDKVVLGHHIPCFKCHYCENENYSMCKHFKETNIIPGGFSEYIYVSEEHLNNTVFLSDSNLTNIEASFLEPLGCCIRAVKRSNIKPDTTNLIIGLGSIGILMGEAAKSFGNKVYGCDLIEERVQLSQSYNFDKSFTLSNENDTLEEMRKYAPLGFDNIFLTAGASSAVDFAVKAVRDGGTIIVFSSIKDNNGFKNNDIYYREITVKGSYSSSPKDLEDSMNLLRSRKVKVEGLSTVYPIEKINEAIKDTISNKIMKAYIEL